MKHKNIILALVLLVLIAFAYLYQVHFKTWQVQKAKPKNFFSKIDLGSIEKIEILKGGKDTILVKQGNNWKIDGDNKFSASQEIVKSFLSEIDTAKKSGLELVSSNKDKKKDFAVDDQGTKITLLGKNNVKISEFVIGNLSGDYLSTYISQPGAAETYSIATSGLGAIIEQNNWRDKTIFETDKNKINKIRFQYPGREFSIEKKNGAWAGVKEEKIDPILSALSSLSAMEIPEQKFQGTGLEKHSIIVEATGDGVKNILMIGSCEENGLCYAKKGDSDNIYLIGKDIQNEFNKKIDDLK